MPWWFGEIACWMKQSQQRYRFHPIQGSIFPINLSERRKVIFPSIRVFAQKLRARPGERPHLPLVGISVIPVGDQPVRDVPGVAEKVFEDRLGGGGGDGLAVSEGPKINCGIYWDTVCFIVECVVRHGGLCPLIEDDNPRFPQPDE